MKKILTIGVIAGLAAGLAACSHTLNAKEQDTAKYGALQFANSLGGRFVSCSGVDTEGKGTVPCTVRIPGGIQHFGRGLDVAEIACAYKGNAGNAGCHIKG